jgi:hypothetical protein
VDTSGAGAQPPAKEQLTLPPWHPGEDLTALEAEMKAKAVEGELVDRGEGPFELAEMQAWGEERAVRAAVLRHLLVEAEWPVHAKGIRLRGVRINGRLDLEAGALRCSLRLGSCYLDADEPVLLDYATLPRLFVKGCHLAGLTGVALSAQEIDLSGSTLTGPLRLSGADIADQLVCTGARLKGKDDYGIALFAEGMKVGNGVMLDGGFTAEGSLALERVDIGGSLLCDGAQLTCHDLDDYAVRADGMRVGGGAFFRQRFTANGAIRLVQADIAILLDCTGGHINHYHRHGYALMADGMKVDGPVRFHGLTATGAVRLSGTDIRGDFICTSAHLKGPDALITSLVGVGMRVRDDVLLDGGFTAHGSIRLESAQVGGSVELRPTALAGEGRLALNAAGAQIAGTLRWKPVEQVVGRVDLRGTSAGELEDDWSGERANGYWPVGGRLRLDGFTYGRFGGDQQADVGQRLAWIRGQYKPKPKPKLKQKLKRKPKPKPLPPGVEIFDYPPKRITTWDSTEYFATQPYELLATVYRRTGRDDQARKVAIARRTDLRKYGKLNWYRKLGNWFLSWSIKYGYQSWRAGIGLAVVFGIFWGLTVLAHRHHLISWAGDLSGFPSEPSATRCTSRYPCFYPFGYTVDTVIPLLNVHQADFWGPDASTPWGAAFQVVTWVATGLGWAMATLLVAGYTGLVRRD